MDKSKTDQEGNLEAKGIAKSEDPQSTYCPVNAQKMVYIFRNKNR